MRPPTRPPSENHAMSTCIAPALDVPARCAAWPAHSAKQRLHSSREFKNEMQAAFCRVPWAGAASSSGVRFEGSVGGGPSALRINRLVALGIVNPALEGRGSPAASTAAEMNRRRESAFGDAPIDGGPAQRRDANYVGHSEEGRGRKGEGGGRLAGFAGRLRHRDFP